MFPEKALRLPIISSCILRITKILVNTLSADIFLKHSQCCLVADDSVSDTENVSSSNRREFDGGIIAHAGGAGGFTHGTGAGGVDPQALTTSGNIS
ncbi:hypothetical protein BY80_04795, partial [Escherichia coli O121:H19 str. K5198]